MQIKKIITIYYIYMKNNFQKVISLHAVRSAKKSTEIYECYSSANYKKIITYFEALFKVVSISRH